MRTTAKADEILAIARAEIGYREGKGKDNKYGRWYGMNNVAWCVEFTQWCYAQAGAKLPFKTASCSALLTWYKANQPECIVSTPVPGCLVIFDLPGTKYLTDHIGIFESISGSYITTIDGNTSSVNDANGGCVNRRKRRKNLVHAYIKPRELSGQTKQTATKPVETKPVAASKQEDEDMVDVSKLTNEDCYAILLKANEYAATLAVPQWGKEELEQAKAAGITDGTRPLATVTRMQAAIMAKRSMEGKA